MSAFSFHSTVKHFDYTIEVMEIRKFKHRHNWPYGQEKGVVEIIIPIRGRKRFLARNAGLLRELGFQL